MEFADVTLPTPTGPFAVGRIAMDWTDPNRVEIYSPTAGEKRELAISIWYPATVPAGAAAGAYLPGGWAALGPAWGFAPDRVRIHAVPDAPVTTGEERLPVLIFSPAGFPPHLFTAMIEELASHGYVIVGVNHTYETTPLTVFADGRTVPGTPAATGNAWLPPTGDFADDLRARASVVDYKAADLRIVADQLFRSEALPAPLAEKIDPTRLGAFGFSLGGAAAAEYCRSDERCRAGANLDGGLWSAVRQAGVAKPLLLVTSEHSELIAPCEALVPTGLFPTTDYCAAFRANAIDGWQTLCARARPGYAIRVRGAEHISFMDLPLLPVSATAPLAAAIAAARLNGRRTWRIVCDYLLAFFGTHLRGIETPLLNGKSTDYPEVEVGRRMRSSRRCGRPT